MHYTIEELMHGNAEVIGFYTTASTAWDELFGPMAGASVEDWSRWLNEKQMTIFEPRCGGRALGQEVQGWSGFAKLYSTDVGFEDNKAKAVKLVLAFAGSGCSLEVKSHAREAALSYHLDEEDGLADVVKRL